MSRGDHSCIAKNAMYYDSNKDWVIELSNTNMVWYDLLVHPHDAAECINTRELTVDYLKNLKEEVESSLEKRFVYFICSRTKVRFNTQYKPNYDLLSNELNIQILIGKYRVKEIIKIRSQDINTKKNRRLIVEITEKYITVHWNSENKITTSIHEFLSGMDINLGICSNIEYVGHTKNPHTRPTNGAHTGLSDMLFSVSNEESDTLLFFNTFKVTTVAMHDKSKMNFYVSNSMTDEVNVDLEGRLIEKSFISYFNPDTQDRNRKRERDELNSSLNKIREEYNINSISCFYELNGDSEYWKFSSSSIAGKMRHSFKIESTKTNPVVRDISEEQFESFP